MQRRVATGEWVQRGTGTGAAVTRPRGLLGLQGSIGNHGVISMLALQRDFTTDANCYTHFKKHGAEFGVTSQSDYEKLANALWSKKKRRVAGVKSKSGSDGVFVYEPSTGTFGKYTSAGKCITLFKPGDATYYDRQG
jgi:pyocin large subunit-like protein